MNNFKLLSTSHSGYRNEVFDQYRILVNLYCRIDKKFEKLVFSKPGGGNVLSDSLKTACARNDALKIYLKQVVGNIFQFILLFKTSKNLQALKNAAQRH